MAVFSVLLLLLSFLCGFKPADGQAVKVRIGWFQADGFQYISQQGNYAGYAYEYSQEIARYTGWSYEIVHGTFQETLERLKLGEVDIAFGIQRTEERTKTMDFSNRPIGTDFALLTARKEDTRFAFNDYSRLDGAVIGVQDGINQIAQLKELSGKYGFQYKMRRYGAPEDMMDALQAGEVDLLLYTSFYRLTDLEKPVAKFAPAPCYCAVRKDAGSLLESLNYALEQIELNTPYYDVTLAQKYFSQDLPSALFLSQEEEAYLRENPVLRVAAFPGMEPFAYMDGGEFSGISADIVRMAADSLRMECVFIDAGTYAQAVELVRDGQADVLVECYSDYAWAEKNGLVLTSPYIQMQYTMIRRQDMEREDIRSVAALSGTYFGESYIRKFYPGQVVYYDTIQECMEAVKEGRQDICYLNVYSADLALQDWHFRDLKANMLSFSHHLSFATSAKGPSILNTLLDKSLRSLESGKIWSVVQENTADKSVPFDLRAYFYEDPAKGLSILAVASGLIIAMFIAIILLRNRNNTEMGNLLYKDPVTGGISYRKFKKDAETHLQTSKEHRHALLYMDIQKFKYINEMFGHEAGNAILCTVAALFRQRLGAGELFSRVYADHFIVLLAYKEDRELQERLAALLKPVERPDGVQTDTPILFRTGVYRIEPGDGNIERASDRASYAKDTLPYSFQNEYAYYDDRMYQRVQWEKELERSMIPALYNREFEAFFQPRVDLEKGCIVGAEALVRWNHLGQGLVMPDAFVPLFERNGFITRVDLYIFEEACKRLRQLMDGGLTGLSISCNFSRLHLADSELPEKLLGLTKKYGVPARCFEIEFTETIATESFDRAVDLSNRLKEYGFLISIDDFCSGYSSIQLLYEIPLDVLKLDKSYIQGEGKAGIEREIITGIIEIAHENGISVVCEGIETQAHEAFVLAQGCSLAQGYRYARPLPFHQFLQLLNSGKLYFEGLKP